MAKPAEQRQLVRQQRNRPLVEAMHAWLSNMLKRIVSAQTKRNQIDMLLPWDSRQQGNIAPVKRAHRQHHQPNGPSAGCAARRACAVMGAKRRSIVHFRPSLYSPRQNSMSGLVGPFCKMDTAP